MAAVQLVSMPQLVEAQCDDDDWTGLRSKRQALRLSNASTITATKKSDGIAPIEMTYRAGSGRNNAASTLIIPAYVSYKGYHVPEQYLYPPSLCHLLPLREYNVYRATMTNILITGHLHLIDKSCGFGGPLTTFPNPYQGSNSLPPSLRRTALQKSATYPDWIDLLPSPRMRDNAVRAQDFMNNRDLAADMLTGLCGRSDTEDCGMLVWTTPWDPRGWEVTEGFVKKWWFLLEGCVDLLESTNRWRRLRGEKRLPLTVN